MRSMFEALLAAASPVESPADLHAILLDGAPDPIRTLQRARGLVASANTQLVTVGPADLPAETDVQLLEQPRDRGTLPGVMLALLRLLPRDPDALVVISAVAPPPAALLGAVAEVVADPDRIALFDAVPGARASTIGEGLAVVAEARLLVRLLFEAAPAWSGVLCEAVFDDEAIARAYRMLPAASFEREVLARHAQRVGLAHGDPARETPIGRATIGVA